MKIALFFPLFFIFLLTFGYAQSLEEELAKYSNPSSYNPENIKRLVSEGADVNTLNRWGNPPLTMAVLKKNVELIKFLLSRGANVNLKNPKGFSPLDFAKKSGNNLIIDLLQGGKLETSLKAALASNKYESNKIIDLIKQGAPVNTLSSSGDTALMVAVRKNDGRVVKALLEKGANVKLENNEKMTALDIARNLKLRKLINLLIADSPEFLLREGLSQKPFSKDLIRKALKKGANIDNENKRGKTPL
ncbi:MAG: ankyrin repeat domain-containing protein, partial [Bdellovibrionota bacterium]|nr:ankyrin repeat domain-containing protein [Bdellovibrionota bacterium]